MIHLIQTAYYNKHFVPHIFVQDFVAVANLKSLIISEPLGFSSSPRFVGRHWSHKNPGLSTVVIGEIPLIEFVFCL